MSRCGFVLRQVRSCRFFFAKQEPCELEYHIAYLSANLRATLSYTGCYKLPFDHAPYENVTLGPAPATCFVPLFSIAYGKEAPPLGSPLFDLLRSESYREASRAKL